MNKKYFIIVIFVYLTAFLMACEDNISVNLPNADPVIVIDAWLDNQPQTQVIKVQKSLPYFETAFSPGISNASVSVEDQTEGIIYDFEPAEDGVYQWEPTTQQPALGDIGHKFKLTVQVGNSLFEAYSTMNRVPPIDSVTFRFEKGNSFFPDSYFASFYALEPKGAGDTYWIKAWKNEYLLNKPNEINISYDAGGSAGAVVDGIVFIQPIRDGINPFDQDENDDFISPYKPGDSVHVELLSINNEAYTFLNEVKIQTDRPGGFAELFAQPLANVSTNISQATEDTEATKAIGFFNVSAVSMGVGWLDPDNLPTEKP